MTIEELRDEKTLLKERIVEALESFYNTTGLEVTGQFQVSLKAVYEHTTNATTIKAKAKVFINPIEI